MKATAMGYLGRQGGVVFMCYPVLLYAVDYVCAWVLLYECGEAHTHRHTCF